MLTDWAMFEFRDDKLTSVIADLYLLTPLTLPIKSDKEEKWLLLYCFLGGGYIQILQVGGHYEETQWPRVSGQGVTHTA